MSKQIHVGSVPVGGGADIAIQSMCNTRTEDVAATVAQILRLEEAYEHYKADPDFNAELNTLLKEYAGRPSRLYFAKK